jgi:hypothetical protein
VNSVTAKQLHFIRCALDTCQPVAKRKCMLGFCYRPAMPSLVRSWLLLLAVFLCCCSISRAQHMNSADAPCRSVAVTIAMENCFDKAYKAADGGLNQLYSQISKVLQPDDLPTVKSSATPLDTISRRDLYGREQPLQRWHCFNSGLFSLP